MRFEGTYTALITPFIDNLLDRDGLRRLIQFQIAGGVDGLVILGTTAETPTLSVSEKHAIIAITLEEVNGRIPVIAGVGSYSTQETIDQALSAERMGVDGLLVVAPYYNRPTQEGLFRHFEAVAEAVHTPIIVYNIQGRTGVNIETDTLARIAELPNIVGVKEASGNIGQANDVIHTIAMQRPEFCVLSGDDAMALAMIAQGGHGVISVISNLVPRETSVMIRAALSGDHGTAKELHHRLYPVYKGAFLESNPVPIKTAMGMQGLPAGEVRLPLWAMSAVNKERLLAALTSFYAPARQAEVRS